MPDAFQFICFLEPSRDTMPEDPTPEEAAAVRAHFEYYSARRDSGELILAGRTLERPWVGIFIFEAASREDAERLVEADPGVKAGVFRTRLQPYRVALLRGVDDV
ncbi:MAG: YciI family protein [Phycisphaerales bacterium]